jgi:hypothetical protein
LFQILRRPIGSTAHLIRHVRVVHKTAYERIKDQLENPDLPETFDPANPIWGFFVASDNKLARCSICLNLLPILVSVLLNFFVTRVRTPLA